MQFSFQFRHIQLGQLFIPWSAPRSGGSRISGVADFGSGGSGKKGLSDRCCVNCMAIQMQTTSPTTSKNFERTIPGTIAKSSTMTTPSQHSPSRPSSAAPNVKNSVPRVKSPLAAAGVGEIITTRELNAGLSPLDSLADALAQTSINHPPEHVIQAAMRPVPGAAPPSQPYMNPGHAPYYGPNVTMNMPPQQGYGPPPQNQYYNAGFNPNGYVPGPNSNRPNSAVPKYQAMDPKASAGVPNQMMPPTGPAQQPNNMGRRSSSNYFTIQPAMSPVQPSHYAAQRGWIVSGGGPIMGSPMQMQNGASQLQGPTIYQPLMAANAPNPPMLTPPPPVQHTYQPGYGPQPVVTPVYGFPTPPETSAAAQPNPNLPPPVPSVFPDPAYSNINTCLNNPKGTTNVYIRGLRPETTDDDLLRMVQQYGTLVSTKAIIDNQAKSCKGYGSS